MFCKTDKKIFDVNNKLLKVTMIHEIKLKDVRNEKG